MASYNVNSTKSNSNDTNNDGASAYEHNRGNGNRVAVYYDSFSAPEIVYYRDDSTPPIGGRVANKYNPIHFDSFISIKGGRNRYAGQSVSKLL